jgi:hypothetical protein
MGLTIYQDIFLTLNITTPYLFPMFSLKNTGQYMHVVFMCLSKTTHLCDLEAHSYSTTRRHGNFAGVHTLLRIILSSNSAVLIKSKIFKFLKRDWDTIPVAEIINGKIEFFSKHQRFLIATESSKYL